MSRDYRLLATPGVFEYLEKMFAETAAAKGIFPGSLAWYGHSYSPTRKELQKFADEYYAKHPEELAMEQAAISMAKHMGEQLNEIIEKEISERP